MQTETFLSGNPYAVKALFLVPPKSIRAILLKAKADHERIDIFHPGRIPILGA